MLVHSKVQMYLCFAANVHSNMFVTWNSGIATTNRFNNRSPKARDTARIPPTLQVPEDSTAFTTQHYGRHNFIRLIRLFCLNTCLHQSYSFDLSKYTISLWINSCKHSKYHSLGSTAGIHSYCFSHCSLNRREYLFSCNISLRALSYSSNIIHFSVYVYKILKKTWMFISIEDLLHLTKQVYFLK